MLGTGGEELEQHTIERGTCHEELHLTHPAMIPVYAAMILGGTGIVAAWLRHRRRKRPTANGGTSRK